MSTRPTSGRIRPLLSATVISLVAALMCSEGLLAQTGTVRGVIVDRSTMRPLQGAQVQVEGAQIGAFTNAEGQYNISNVPAGDQTIRVIYIGYRTAVEAVSVPADGIVELNFEMVSSAVGLDEIVVTGTAGAVERRRVGASLATLNVSDIQEVVPVPDVGTALQARIPGVRSIGTTGGVGSGRDLRIRGVSSLTLGQRPVVYIDGVRVDTRNEEWGGMQGTTCCSFSGGAGEDRLSDLNPADIDRIEVLKGAAATTLYGSEATNGVIQIFTKRGRSDTPAEWQASVSTGFNRLRPNLPTRLYPNFTGPDGFRAWDANETLIETGLIHRYELSVRGGAERVTYFLSGSYSDEEGSLKPNYQRRGNMRVNLNFTPSDEWNVDVTTGFSRNEIWALQSGNNWLTMLGQVNRGNPRAATAQRPYGEPWIDISAVKEIETISFANRFTGAMTAVHTPRTNFSNRVTVGIDYLSDEKSRILPFGNWYIYVGEEGEKNVGYRNFSSVSMDYLGSLNFDLSQDVSTELAWGAQGFREVERLSMATGQFYAGPGVTTIRGGAETTADETWKETVNVGLFAQNRFGYRDYLFTTVGVRADGNSAFGTNYGIKAYPKVDLSFVASDAMDLPRSISSLRIRSAIGWSGLAPGAFDQFRTFEAAPVLDDMPGVTPANPGNPDLRPEETREIEGGFEVGLFDDRLGVEVSAFHALTTDALLPVQLPHSAGFPQVQLQNAGELRNVGWEFAVNAQVLESPRFRWGTRLNLDYNRNKILDLGPDAQNGQLGAHREGYPVGALFERVMIGWDPEARTHLRSDTEEFIGPPLPTHNLSWANNFEFRNFRIHTLVSAERGAWFSNHELRTQNRFETGDQYLALLGPAGEATPAADSLKNHADMFVYTMKRDNIRLREVSLSYRVPSAFAGRVGLSGATITLSGENLHWWDSCQCMDPNGAHRGGDDFAGNWTNIMYAVPMPRRIVATVRTTF
jgi:TonB-dependent starch-binding outer membrane protein SusC